MTHDADGSFRLQFTGWAAASWHVQVNFAPLPIGESGKTYRVSFNYEINVAGGDYGIFDNNQPVGENKSLATGSNTATVDYNGHALSDANKFSIELGSLPAQSVVFVIHSIALSEVA